MNKLILICFVLCASSFGYAQEVPVKLIIAGAKGGPLGAATVVVIPAADSNAKQTQLADTLGVVVFKLQQNRISLFIKNKINRSFLM